jgi:AcrR family transcriptional regulator
MHVVIDNIGPDGHYFLVSDGYHHPDLRPRLIAAARQALIERPDPAELSVRALARGMGVSANAPYRHFADRDGLLQAVVAAGYRSLAADLASRAERPGGAAAVAAVWQGFAAREPALALLLTARVADDEVRAAALEWLAEVVRAVEFEVGTADPARLLRRAIGCWATVVGITALERSASLSAIEDWLVPSAARLAHRAVRG